jgi:hypothetical protein
MKYIEFSKEGKLCARYDSEINNTIPTDAIELSEELFLANNH